MFQIKHVDMITKTFRLPEDMLKELEVLAQKNNISVNKLVIQCCRYALDNQEPEEPEEDDSPGASPAEKHPAELSS